MRTSLRIPTSRTHGVYGIYDGVRGKPLVIFVHGLPGSVVDGLHERACAWFAAHGYATFRYNLYGWQSDARQLIDTTLRILADDLDAIVRFFRSQGTKRIFVVGHSLGGPQILLAKEQAFDGAVLLDPSYDISFIKEKYGFPGGKYIRSLRGYFMQWGINTVIGRAMAQEVDAIDWNALPKTFHKPLKIITAEKGVLVRGARAYFSHAQAPKNLQIVKGATHYFNDRPGMEDRVFASIFSWFEKYR